MRISDEGIALIKRFEGFSSHPYICPAGISTIGYGHTKTASERGAVTKVQAEALLRDDVRAAEWAVIRLIHVPLTQGQFDALVSFSFNLGSGALQRSTLRCVVNREAHVEVPRQLMRWVFASGRKLKGLEKRRAAEAALYIG